MVLAPPRSVVERTADLQEVYSMIEAGEIDIAVDELRWLLNDCPELLEAHKLLGDIAVGDEDWELARAHYGRAYEIGSKAVGTRHNILLPSSQPGNAVFYEAARSLVKVLEKQLEVKLAETIKTRLKSFDLTVF